MCMRSRWKIGFDVRCLPPTSPLTSGRAAMNRDCRLPRAAHVIRNERLTPNTRGACTIASIELRFRRSGKSSIFVYTFHVSYIFDD